MIDLAIRPMLDTEATLVRDSWTRSLDGYQQRADDTRKWRAKRGYPPVRPPSPSGNYIVRVGGSDLLETPREDHDTFIIGWAWFEMHRTWVRSLLDQPDTHVLVATLPGHDEAIAWCCVTMPGRHPLVVHYVYTLAIARGKGVATDLVRTALALGDGRNPRFSHSTAQGMRLVEHAKEAVAA